MSILATLKELVAAVFTTFLALVGAGAPMPDTIPQTATIIEEIADSAIEQSATSTAPASSPFIEAYELGKAIGKLEGAVEALEIKASSTPVTPQIAPDPAPVPVTIPAPVFIPQPQSQYPIQSQNPILKAPMADIEIVSPIPSKGLGRTYKANNYKINPDGTLAEGSVEPSIENSIFLGLVVRDDNGDPRRDAVVKVDATDTSQSREINGTGNSSKINGKDGVYYYPFNYEFRTTGTHTITFTALGVSKSVDILVE